MRPTTTGGLGGGEADAMTLAPGMLARGPFGSHDRLRALAVIDGGLDKELAALRHAQARVVFGVRTTLLFHLSLIIVWTTSISFTTPLPPNAHFSPIQLPEPLPSLMLPLPPNSHFSPIQLPAPLSSLMLPLPPDSHLPPPRRDHAELPTLGERGPVARGEQKQKESPRSCLAATARPCACPRRAVAEC